MILHWEVCARFSQKCTRGNDNIVVAHASELALLFGPIPAAAQVETDFANTFLDFYINFVNDLNPGRSLFLRKLPIVPC
jgi:hypothetical protein